jgi:hypothetical protein
MSDSRLSTWLKIFLLIAISVCSCGVAPTAFASPEACSANPESGQMDFWLGDWTVTYPGITGQTAKFTSNSTSA